MLIITDLIRKLTTNLCNYLDAELNNIYQDALGFVKIKTQNKAKFPSECTYSLEQLLNQEWWP